MHELVELRRDLAALDQREVLLVDSDVNDLMPNPISHWLDWHWYCMSCSSDRIGENATHTAQPRRLHVIWPARASFAAPGAEFSKHRFSRLVTFAYASSLPTILNHPPFHHCPWKIYDSHDTSPTLPYSTDIFMANITRHAPSNCVCASASAPGSASHSGLLPR